jgi:hypothetical protein
MNLHICFSDILFVDYNHATASNEARAKYILAQDLQKKNYFYLCSAIKSVFANVHFSFAAWLFDIVFSSNYSY